MSWSGLEIHNAVRDLSRYMTTGTTQAHVKAMECAMNYCLSTREIGLQLRLKAEWTGNPQFKLKILWRSDSDYAKDLETRKSISSTSTFLWGTPIIQRSMMQKIVPYQLQKQSWLWWRQRHKTWCMCTRHDVCEATFRIDQFESRIAHDFRWTTKGSWFNQQLQCGWQDTAHGNKAIPEVM